MAFYHGTAQEVNAGGQRAGRVFSIQSVRSPRYPEPWDNSVPWHMNRWSWSPAPQMRAPFFAHQWSWSPFQVSSHMLAREWSWRQTRRRRRRRNRRRRSRRFWNPSNLTTPVYRAIPVDVRSKRPSSVTTSCHIPISGKPKNLSSAQESIETKKENTSLSVGSPAAISEQATTDEGSRSPSPDSVSDQTPSTGRSRSPSPEAVSDQTPSTGRSRSPSPEAVLDQTPSTVRSRSPSPEAVLDQTPSTGRSRSPSPEAVLDQTPNTGGSRSPSPEAVSDQTPSTGRSRSPFPEAVLDHTPSTGRSRSPSPEAVLDQTLNTEGSRSPSPEAVLDQTLNIEGSRSPSPEAVLDQTLNTEGSRSPSPEAVLDQTLNIEGSRSPSPEAVSDQTLNTEGSRSPSPEAVLDQTLNTGGSRSPSPEAVLDQTLNTEGSRSPSPEAVLDQTPNTGGSRSPSPVVESDQTLNRSASPVAVFDEIQNGSASQGAMSGQTPNQVPSSVTPSAQTPSKSGPQTIVSGHLPDNSPLHAAYSQRQNSRSCKSSPPVDELICGRFERSLSIDEFLETPANKEITSPYSIERLIQSSTMEWSNRTMEEPIQLSESEQSKSPVVSSSSKSESLSAVRDSSSRSTCSRMKVTSPGGKDNRSPADCSSLTENTLSMIELSVGKLVQSLRYKESTDNPLLNEKNQSPRSEGPQNLSQDDVITQKAETIRSKNPFSNDQFANSSSSVSKNLPPHNVPKETKTNEQQENILSINISSLKPDDIDLCSPSSVQAFTESKTPKSTFKKDMAFQSSTTRKSESSLMTDASCNISSKNVPIDISPETLSSSTNEETLPIVNKSETSAAFAFNTIEPSVTRSDGSMPYVIMPQAVPAEEAASTLTIEQHMRTSKDDTGPSPAVVCSPALKKSRTPSPIAGSSPTHGRATSPSPVAGSLSAPERSRNPSPVGVSSPALEEYRSPSPDAVSSPSLEGSRSPSPVDESSSVLEESWGASLDSVTSVLDITSSLSPDSSSSSMPVRSRSPSPVGMSSPTSVRSRSPSPVGVSSPTPVRSRSPSPVGVSSPTSVRSRSPSPVGVSSPTPVRSRSPSPVGVSSPTPVRSRSPSPVGVSSPTPVRSRSPSPVGVSSPTPVRSRSPSPVGVSSPTPVRSRTPSPVGMSSPTPVRSRSPSPVGVSSPTSVRSRSPSPVGVSSPTPVRSRSPSPVGVSSPTPVRSRSPSPVGVSSPTPVRSRSPSPVGVSSPTSVRSRSPSPVGVSSPTPVRSRSPSADGLVPPLTGGSRGVSSIFRSTSQGCRNLPSMDVSPPTVEYQVSATPPTLEVDSLETMRGGYGRTYVPQFTRKRCMSLSQDSDKVPPKKRCPFPSVTGSVVLHERKERSITMSPVGVKRTRSSFPPDETPSMNQSSKKCRIQEPSLDPADLLARLHGGALALTPTDTKSNVHRNTVITRAATQRLIRRSPNHALLYISNKRMELFKAVENGDLDCVQELIQDTGPAIRRDGTNCTLLHTAATYNQLDIVMFLLKLISPNVVNREGQTPAHLAALKGHTQVLRILLADHQLNHNKRDNSNRTYKDLLSASLFEAVVNSDRSRVQELLKLGADPDYHADSLVDGVLERELQVTTARQLALTLHREAIIRVFPKEKPPEEPIDITPSLSFSPDSVDLQGTPDNQLFQSLRLMVRPALTPALGPDVYRMDTDPKGYVCILGYSSFEDRPDLDLEGSQPDVHNLANVFGKMGYTGHAHSSLTADQTKQTLSRVRDMEELEQAGCAVFIISSHGTGEGKFLTSDMKLLSTEWLCDFFKDSECPRLKNKPKLFIFDFCCGYYKDQSPRRGTTGKGMRVEEPLQDMMCLYSSSGGFTSYTFTKNGTPFTMALCRTLAQHAHDKEFGDLYREFLKEYSKTSPATIPQLRNIGFTKRFYFSPVTRRL